MEEFKNSTEQEIHEIKSKPPYFFKEKNIESKRIKVRKISIKKSSTLIDNMQLLKSK